jgi:hypothetical protein
LPRRIESLFIDGPVGRLEALLEEPEYDEPEYDEPEAGAPRMAALICHPHPQYGGTMHNKVVYRMARGLRHIGAAVLRFNYRGVNLSEGVYDNSYGETDDARAALAFLRARYPSLPFLVAGFSFGSRIVLRIGCEAPRPFAVVSVGSPASYWDQEERTGRGGVLPEDAKPEAGRGRPARFRGTFGRCDVPRIFIQSTHDQYGPRETMQTYFDSLEGPKKIVWIEARNHFFSDGLDAFEKALIEVVEAQFAMKAPGAPLANQAGHTLE